MKLQICGLIALCLSQALFAPLASAAITLSDKAITNEMLGAWIVPESSTDYGEYNARAVATYLANGTSVTEFFGDTACTKVKARVIARWSIKNGKMTIIHANGNTDVDKIVSIGNGKLALHSLGDGTTYTRVKAASCGMPTS